MTTKLSDRVRPNSEAAPWVIDEIKKLEAEAASKYCPHGVYWHACGDPTCANMDEFFDEVDGVCEQRVSDMRLALLQSLDNSDSLLQQIAGMQPVVDAAIKWWKAQELSDTEYHNAEQELSAIVGKYCVRNNL